MLDPLTLKLAFEGVKLAFNGIQYCCEALGEGKVQVQRIRKAADDAKAIVSDAKSVWSTIKGLFGGKPAASSIIQEPASSTVKAPSLTQKKGKKEEYVEHIPDEDEIVDQFISHLGNFFKYQTQLVDHIEARWAQIDQGDPSGDNSQEVLELTALEHKLSNFSLQLSELMKVRAPKQLGPFYSKFKATHERVVERQRAVRETRRKKESREKWLRDQRHKINFAKAAYALVMGLAILVAMAMFSILWASSGYGLSSSHSLFSASLGWPCWPCT